MAKHRKFNVDRFTDKFQGREDILRSYVEQWDWNPGAWGESLDVPAFKDLVGGGVKVRRAAG